MIPGISSMQVACARTRVNLTNLSNYASRTSTAKAELIRELKNGKYVLRRMNFRF